MKNIIIFFILITIILVILVSSIVKTKKKRLTIFTSSFNLKYQDNIKKLINKLDPNKIIIVIGSRYEGLMGVISETFIKNKGEVISVNTKQFINPKFNDDYEYDNLRDRQNKLIELGDEYLILPGGIGTTSELVDVLIKNNIKESNKKIYIYNIDGFYDNIMNHINYLNKENFIYGDGFKGLNINISSNMDYIVNKINNIK
jgi:uncharacterized protein (TIGR00730 family)